MKNQRVRINTGVRSEFFEFDRYDLYNSFELVLNDANSIPGKIKDLLTSFIKSEMTESDISALLYFNFDLRVMR